MTAEHQIFLHIPKTAGSTLHDVIHRNYREDQMFSLYNIREFEKFTLLPEEKRNSVKLLKGHLPFGIHNSFTKGSAEYFTILREPIDRVVSNYYHYTEEKTHPFYKEFHEKKYTIIELVESGKIANMNNCMVRFLSGDFARPYNECDDGMLEKALDHLDKHFPIVGLNEDFDTFLMRVRERYNWKFPYYKRKRVRKNRPRVSELDAKTVQCIAEYNKLDAELYRIMREKVVAQQEALGPELKIRTERFRKYNRWINKVARMVGR